MSTNVTLKGIVNSEVTELMPKSNADRIHFDDHSTLPTKIAKLEEEISLRETSENVDAKIQELKSQSESSVSSAVAEANTYCDTKASETKTYVDTEIGNAKVYSDNAASSALTDAKTYADTKASDALTDAKTYADTKIADLIDGAPSTLDTLKEVADAMADNENIVKALEESIGQKANAKDLAKVATSGSYSDLSDVPPIPTKLSEFENDTVLEENQNAFSNVRIGASTVAALAKTDTLQIDGKNVTIAADAENKKITLEVTANNVTAALGFTPPKTNTDTKVTQTVTDTDAWLPLLLAPAGQTETATGTSYFDKEVLLNPSTNTIAANISGQAAKAEKDSEGNVISETYATKAEAGESKGTTYELTKDGSTIKLIGSDGTETSVEDADTNTTYTPATDAKDGLMTASDKAKLDYTNLACAVCETDGATAEKVVTIIGNSNWKLKEGAVVAIKFTNTNTASSVTLNVNGTGAKSIWYNTGVYTAASGTQCGTAGRYIKYMYDGTYWVWIGHGVDFNTTYTNVSLGHGYGTCATAAATVAKSVALSGYSLQVNGYVTVKFTYDVPANATMNINSKGAKPIFFKGAAITAGVIKGGDIATFIYTGSQYYLVAIDRIIDSAEKSKLYVSTTKPSALTSNDLWFQLNSN